MKTILLATTLLACSVANGMAAEPLVSGHPAGVRQAQLSGGEGMLVVAGAAAIGFAVALATAGSGPGVANPNGSGSTSTSTTGTP